MNDSALKKSETETVSVEQKIGAMTIDAKLENSSTRLIGLPRATDNSILISSIIANDFVDSVNRKRSLIEEVRVASSKFRNWIRRLKPKTKYDKLQQGEQSPRHFWPEDDFRVDLGDEHSLGLPDHLVPFIPYIEKCALSYSPDIELDMVTDRNPADTIKNWMDFCDSKHGLVCKNHRLGQEAHASAPCLLIDVQEMCITQNTTSANYVALSYVWGTGESFCTTTDNVKDLLQPRSLEREPFVPPRTILDAMKLVQDIGERYLWVDRLCIKQDDQDTKQQELHMMGSIYARSILTICAAENDSAMEGLYATPETTVDVFGLRYPESFSEVFRQSYEPPHSPSSFVRSASAYSSVLRSSSTDHRRRMLAHAQLLMRSAWFSRGWTFQENLFSSRKLIFHNGRAHWECHCAAWHENQDPGDDNHFLSSTTVEKVANQQLWEGGFEYSRWPNMFRFSRLVSIFNDRTLTFQEDALDAFAGVLGVLGNTFEGGFLSGLPVFCFDAAMLWQPWSPMKRRKPTRPTLENFTLPSWSWAGWWGVINSESWRSAGSYIKEDGDDGLQTSWITRNTVSWKYSRTLNGPKRSVNTLSLIGSPSRWEAVADVDLPQGWTRQRGQKGNYFYNHQSAPGQAFVYPIPIREPTPDPVLPIYANFLHGRTRRGYLQSGAIYISIASQCDVVELITASGTWAGILRLSSLRLGNPLGDVSTMNSDELPFPYNSPEYKRPTSTIMRPLNYFDASTYYLAHPPQPDTERVRGTLYPRTRHRASSDPIASLASTKFELIEISAGSVENQEFEKVCFDEWESPHCPRRHGRYEFYNVLWIEWIGGVAYRKALGRVEKSVWEAETKDDIDLVLG